MWWNIVKTQVVTKYVICLVCHEAFEHLEFFGGKKKLFFVTFIGMRNMIYVIQLRASLRVLFFFFVCVIGLLTLLVY